LQGVEEVSSALRQSDPFAIAFIDMRMPPGIDGLETAQRILNVDPHIEIVILTAYSDTSLQSLAQHLGDSRFLLLKKPFDPDELTQMAQFLTFRWEIGQLNRAYERFVPKEFLELLNKKHITQVRIGDHVEMPMSILFADIRSFTSLSESLTPTENFRFLNSYLGLMGPVIRRNNGIIDKFIGDAIMALFREEPDDAVRSALEMLRSLRWYNQGRARAGYSQIRIGIGVHTGSVMLGTIGEHYRMEGSVVSDAVNLASRIEMLTKLYATDLIISESTYDGLKDPNAYHIRLIDWTAVRGRSKPVRLYEVYDEEVEPVKAFKLEHRERFEQAVQEFHDEKLEDAQEQFMNIAEAGAHDSVVTLYLERIQHIQDYGHYAPLDRM
jgi:two-component system sensor histidine kinase ChiS